MVEKNVISQENKSSLPIIWAIFLAGDVNAKPSEHSRDPAIATFRYEYSFNNGPTNKPEKFIITS